MIGFIYILTAVLFVLGFLYILKLRKDNRVLECKKNFYNYLFLDWEFRYRTNSFVYSRLLDHVRDLQGEAAVERWLSDHTALVMEMKADKVPPFDTDIEVIRAARR